MHADYDLVVHVLLTHQSVGYSDLLVSSSSPPFLVVGLGRTTHCCDKGRFHDTGPLLLRKANS